MVTEDFIYEIKKTIVSMVITIIIAVLIICTMFIVRNAIAKDKIKSKVKLSEEEKSNLNYQQLIEDIKSEEEGHGVKYAKQEENTDGGKFKLKDRYIGDGYIILYKKSEEE